MATSTMMTATITKPTTTQAHDPTHLALTRMLERFSYLILQTPTSSTKLDRNLAHLQSQTQQELWQPLPFHRMKWLRSIETARTLLLKLEQSAQNIKVQRTRQTFVRDLAEKRMTIKRLKGRVEEIGREVESGSAPRVIHQDDESETLLDVLQQVRRDKGKNAVQMVTDDVQPAIDSRDQLFDTTDSRLRKRGKTEEPTSKTSGFGFANLKDTEDSLMVASKTHENITADLLRMAAQLKQQSMAFNFTLEQDKGLVDRAVDGLEGNMNAMGVASRGMKTLQRMSEEEGWLGRLKLQAMIAGLWIVAVLIVFVGPKLRF